MSFHEKAGRSQADSFLFLWDIFFSCRVATVAMLPSALSRSQSFGSVQVGRSRFSRCCHLFVVLWFCSRRVEPGPSVLTQSPELGFGFCLFSSWNGFDFVVFAFFDLCGCRCNCNSMAVVQGLVHFSAHPQVMQQHRQLSGCGHEGSLLAVPATALRQLQAPAPEIAVDPEGSQDVLCPLHQQRAQIGIAFLADMQLRIALSRFPPSRLQSQIAASVPAL